MFLRNYKKSLSMRDQIMVGPDHGSALVPINENLCFHCVQTQFNSNICFVLSGMQNALNPILHINLNGKRRNIVCPTDSDRYATDSAPVRVEAFIDQSGNVT